MWWHLLHRISQYFESVRVKKGLWGWYISSKCPEMGEFMNIGSNKWTSRFSEILNSVMEKNPSAKVEIMRLLLFRDPWYLGSFFLSPKGAVLFLSLVIPSLFFLSVNIVLKNWKRPFLPLFGVWSTRKAAWVGISAVNAFPIKQPVVRTP